ncbi:hypothetical protein [Alistipes sp.]|uniref:hypothetical protein n=1 Tax=Alistipes sp. TaxID=1872444 RepID=UPI0025BDF69B|nr:hypothetical protein [Alistipes sp.]
MKLLLLLLFSLTAACTVVLLSAISRARNKRLLLNAVRRASSDAPDAIGISVLCSGVTDAAQLENLLSPEYAHYEVIVVLDAQRHSADFAALVARYRMIRVEWACLGELDVSGVRALGRSRRRCFRRLVLVDRAWDSAAGDFDAAAAVATYDYLLPVRAGSFLLPGSVERLVACLGEGRSGSLDLIRSPLGEPAVLLRREAVVVAGGFGMHPMRGIPRSRRRMLWEPLLAAPRSGARLSDALQAGARMSGALRGLAAVSLAAAFAAAAAVGWWTSAAALATLALVWAGGECAARLAGGAVFPPSGGLTAWRRLFGHD